MKADLNRMDSLSINQKQAVMAESSGSFGPVVLSFHDCLLRESDVNLLDEPYWLNDKIIEFAYE